MSHRYLLFGGPYSNLESLKALRVIARDAGFTPEQVICTGDIVGYCAHPEETVTLLREWGIRSICGNVEIQLREGKEDCGCDFEVGGACDIYSRNWYPYAVRRLSASSIDWMGTLPEHLKIQVGGHEATVVHGSLHKTSEFIFRSTPWEVKAKNFEDAETDIIIAGHCGLPFSQEGEGRLWLNPGVIGMPANDGTRRVWFMTVECLPDGGLLVEHHSYGYDHEATAMAMEREGLPKGYIETLRTGIWDNCEILPAEETARQGVALEGEILGE